MEATTPSPHGLSDADIRAFLARLGERCERRAALYLLGGSALILLGSPRSTIDLDYVGSDLPGQRDELQSMIHQVADEMRIQVEAVMMIAHAARSSFNLDVQQIRAHRDALARIK